MTAWQWPGSTITNVVDGDTFDAAVKRDLGFVLGFVTLNVRLRLNRINAPSITSDRGKQARSFVQNVVVLNDTVLIETIQPYKFGGPDWSPGEWMAEVTLQDGRNLSDALVTAGLAVYWNGTGPRPADK